MTTVLKLTVAIAACAMLPTIAAAQKTTADYHPGQDFAALKTFAFAAQPPSSTSGTALTDDSPFVRQNTNAAIAAQLEARGMRRDDAHPDVYVRTHRAFKTEYVAYGPYYGGLWGYGYGYGYGYGGAFSNEEVVTGTLAVDLADAKNGQLIWRGVGERTVHPMSKPDHRNKRIYKEVSKIFKDFPAVGVATSGNDVPKAVD
jgi:hypothetical protein